MFERICLYCNVAGLVVVNDGVLDLVVNTLWLFRVVVLSR